MFNTLPSGSIKLDIFTGIGGYPMGHITEIYGPAQSAKTSMALSFIRKNQIGRVAAVIDAEHKLNITYVKAMGLDLRNIIIFQGSKMNDITEFINTMFMQSVDMVILDSIASVNTTRSELWHLFSQLSDQIPSNTSVIWLNQIRTKITSNKNVSYGGKSVKFYPAIRIMLDSPVAISMGRKKIGTTVMCSVSKNAFLKNIQESQPVDIFYEKGTWEALEIIDLALSCQLIECRGTWYYYRDRCLGNGRYTAAKTIETLPVYPSIIKTIRKELIGEHF